MNPNPTVKVSGLGKRYGRVDALGPIDLEFHAGSFTALVGPNGAGKSTLLKLLMRLEEPDRGDAFVLGRSIHTDDALFNAAVGYVSEQTEYRLPGALAAVTRILAQMHPGWDQDRFDRINRDFEINSRRSFDQLSRGQKIQFAFAVAWAIRPKLLILDEVTAVLDPSLRLGVVGYLKEFRDDGGTVILATNVLSEVHNAADRLVILDGGRVRFDQIAANFNEGFVKLRRTAGEPGQIFAHPSCREIGVNPDGSLSYLMPRTADVAFAETLEDRRGVTPEDLFIFHTRKAA